MGNILSFSGGKDSTAMLHLMLERGEQIDGVFYCDMGDWEFPEMSDHISLVEEKTGVHINRIVLPDLTYIAFQHTYELKNGTKKRYGWPSIKRRWCTGIKQNELIKVQRKYKYSVPCVGLALDEIKRKKHTNVRYPLIEYGYTEEMCLDYCKKLGYHWNGLYNWQKRVSCWCCPLQGLQNLKALRKNRPELWEKLMEWDQLNNHYFKYKDVGVFELEARFAAEDIHKEE